MPEWEFDRHFECPKCGYQSDRLMHVLGCDDPFITYAMADPTELIFGEFSFVTELDFFEDREEEVRLIKRTYKLLSEEEIVLPDPYPIEDDEDEQPPERTAEMVANHQHWVWMNDTERWEVRGTGVSDVEPL